MSRESKILQVGPWGAQSTVSHYESFGWELVSMNGNQIVMSRETQDSVYPELVKHQAAYEEKVAEFNALKAPAATKLPSAPVAPAPISIKTCVLLFILMIFPFVLYLLYKTKQKNAYSETLAAHNAACAELKANAKKAMDTYNATKSRLAEEAERIAAESRAIFFSHRA